MNRHYWVTRGSRTWARDATSSFRRKPESRLFNLVFCAGLDPNACPGSRSGVRRGDDRAYSVSAESATSTSSAAAWVTGDRYLQRIIDMASAGGLCWPL